MVNFVSGVKFCPFSYVLGRILIILVEEGVNICPLSFRECPPIKRRGYKNLDFAVANFDMPHPQTLVTNSNDKKRCTP